MSFESVSANALKISSEACKKNINSTSITDCLNTVLSYENWETNAKKVLQQGLTDLQNLYNELNDLYAKLFKVINMLEQYKELELEIKENKRKIEILNDSLYYEEEYTETTINELGVEVEEIKTRIVKNETIEKRINELQIKISNDMIRLEKLEISIKTQAQ